MTKTAAVNRPSSLSLSVLISITLLYIVLMAVALLFSNQVLSSAGSLEQHESSSLIVYILASLFPLVLGGALVFQIVRLIQQFRQAAPGIRFKLRIVLFLNAVTLLATVPQAILFSNFISGLVETGVVKEAKRALRQGSSWAGNELESRLQSLNNLSQAPLLDIWFKPQDIDASWSILHSLEDPVDAMQVIDSQGLLYNYGSSEYWLEINDLQNMPRLELQRSSGSIGTVSRIMIPDSNSPSIFILSRAISPVLEETAQILSKSNTTFSAFIDIRNSIAPLISIVFLVFMIPLVLLSILTGFFLADEIIRPLINLEHTMMRIGHGDYTVRMAVRRGDEMDFLVHSFNRMVNELGRSRQNLKQNERLQAWQDIAQRMAHEIKNPLTPIKLSAQRIQRHFELGKPELGAMLSESVATIVQEVDNLAAMLSEFRNFARLPLPVKETVSLIALIQDTWVVYNSQDRVHLYLEGLNNECHLDADPSQLRQVFKNLFQNAIDAIPAEGVINVHCDVIDRDGEALIRIQVDDSGPGIPEKIMEDIFTPYFTTKKTGSGLGLAIVEKIILDHGGEIWCENTRGQGACFVMELPRG